MEIERDCGFWDKKESDYESSTARVCHGSINCLLYKVVYLLISVKVSSTCKYAIALSVYGLHDLIY